MDTLFLSKFIAESQFTMRIAFGMSGSFGAGIATLIAWADFSAAEN